MDPDVQEDEEDEGGWGVDFLSSWLADTSEPKEQLAAPVLAPEPVAAEHAEEEHLELFYLASFLLLVFMIFHIVKKHLADSQRKTAWLANMSRSAR